MKTDYFFKGFLAALLFIGLIWARSGLGKIIEGKFVDSLGTVLTKTAKGNPYPWYKNFLETVAIPNSQLFAQLTMWGEFLTALSVTLGSIYLLFSKRKQKLGYLVLIAGLVGGMFLNLSFWLGFGYTSPSSDSLNLLMFFIELTGVVVFLKALKTDI